MRAWTRRTLSVTLVRFGLGAVTLAVVAGCASSAAGTSAAGGSTATPARYVLTDADLERAKATNLFDAIQSLRPEFFHGRLAQKDFVPQVMQKADGSYTPKDPNANGLVIPVVVYKDDVKYGTIEDLRQVPISAVREVRFLQGPQAVIRFGADNASGVILITSK